MPATPNNIAKAVAGLDYWLDTMRGPGGYSGPVAHWSESSLMYSGVQLDWRVEGIIGGYLTLYQRTGGSRWLTKARRAADDLVDGQSPDGRFYSSGFHGAPEMGSALHEAVATTVLFQLARTLQDEGNSGDSASYLDAARRALCDSLIPRLWMGSGFADQPHGLMPAPNMNAAMLEALMLAEDLTGVPYGPFIGSTVQAILAAQIRDGSARDGAIIDRGSGRDALVFGIDTARCVSAMSLYYAQSPLSRVREFITRAVEYLTQLVEPRGTILGHRSTDAPVYAPLWLSPSGELLRALTLAQAVIKVEPEIIGTLITLLLDSQTPLGSIPTARGFAYIGVSHPVFGVPEFRDLLPVTGWADKTFRALAMHVEPNAALTFVPAPYTADCTWRGQMCRFREDETHIELQLADTAQTLYHWRKGRDYPHTYAL